MEESEWERVQLSIDRDGGKFRKFFSENITVVSLGNLQVICDIFVTRVYIGGMDYQL